MTPPTTPRYRMPYGDLNSAMTLLDTLIMGAWGPNLTTLVASTRTFGYHGGYSSGGLIADGTIVIPNSSTKYVQRTTAGVVSADAALDVTKIPMAIVTAAGGAITHFEDIRDLFFTQIYTQLSNAIAAAYPLTTLGDIFVAGAAGVAGRLGLSGVPDGYVVTKTSGVPAWAAPGGGGGGGADIYVATVFQAHCEGANNSTTITDSSEQAATSTAIGTAKITTAASKFGSSCVIFDGTSGGGVHFPYNINYWWGGIGVVEFWFKTTQSGRQFATLMENGSSGGSWEILINSGTSTDGKIAVWSSTFNPSAAWLTSPSAVNDGSWHHFAWTIQGGLHTMFIDGVPVARAVSSAIRGDATGSGTGPQLRLGYSSTASREYNGVMDEIRIAIANPFPQSFTPPTSAYADA